MPKTSDVLKACVRALNDAPGFMFNAGDNPLGLKTNPRNNCASSYDLVSIVEKIVPPEDVDDRELATILAALRFWQRHGESRQANEPEYDIATNAGTLSPLADAEIDALCERLNR